MTVGAGGLAETTPAAAGRRRRLDLSATPGRLRLLLAGLVLLSLAWGALAAFTASRYASAASAVVSVREPLSRDALRITRNLSDAGDTAATAFLTGGLEPARARQRYLADIRAAGTGIQDATARGGDPGADHADLATLAADLPVYTGEIETARADNRLGLPLGAAYLREASALMRGRLEPAAAGLWGAEDRSRLAVSAQATGLPLVAVTLAAGLCAGGALFLASRWLARRTNRVLNAGLVTAGVALAASVLWLAAAYAGGRHDLLAAQARGSTPATAVALAAIVTQQMHGYESLTLIDNSGDDAFQRDFLREQRLLGPGRGTLLGDASAAGGPGAVAVASAVADAQNWYTAHAAVRKMDDSGNHAGAVRSVLDTSAGAGFAYAHLSADLSSAINADQAAFSAQAQSGASAFIALEPGVIAAALVMALACAWGLNRRIAEYR